MSEFNKESIQYLYYDSKKISEKRQEIYEFLLSLTVEREPLLWRDEIDEEEYPEDCKKMASRIENAVIAYHENKIVGIETCSKKGAGLLTKFWPLRDGFTVVKSEYQRRGIGRKLYQVHDEYLKSRWFFWHHVTKIENMAMLQLDENFGVIRVGDDGKFVHGFKPNKDKLKIFNPIAYMLLKLFYVEKYRIRKLSEIVYAVRGRVYSNAR